jgi:hypothetical protein
MATINCYFIVSLLCPPYIFKFTGGHGRGTYVSNWMYEILIEGYHWACSDVREIKISKLK